MKKALPILIYTLVLVLATGLIASGATLLIVSSVRLDQGETVVISQEEYATLQRYSKLTNLMSVIESAYVDDVSAEELIENAAYGMVALLGDPYSYYLTPEDMASLQESDSGRYVGVGATFTTDPEDGSMILTRIYPDSPASEAGMQVGDQLIGVNGEDIRSMDTAAVTSLVRGEAGTELTMTVLRGEEEIDFPMVRREVEVVDVEYDMTEDGILRITLSAFSTNADTAFEEAIQYGQENDMKGILLDLRGNGGGADNILQPIADLLLPEGLLFYTEDHHGNRHGHDHLWQGHRPEHLYRLLGRLRPAPDDRARLLAARPQLERRGPHARHRRRAARGAARQPAPAHGGERRAVHRGHGGAALHDRGGGGRRLIP